MKINARKICNRCGRVVAEKSGFFFHTKEKYITVRVDDITSYVNYEDNTTANKFHYCHDCWESFVGAIEIEGF